MLTPSQRYQSGFGNHFESEALPGALPVGRNSPQRPAYGLYAEQLSGTAFTAPQAGNLRSWLYRIRPSVRHSGRFRALDPGLIRSAPAARHESALPIGPERWNPVAIPDRPLSFVEGLSTITTAGDCDTQCGIAVHLAFVTRAMADEYFCNADGELLVVAQEGRLRFRTEFGVLEVAPGEVALIRRGMVFAVDPLDRAARAYVCENYGRPFTLPDRGPIGANALASPRDFLAPVAAYEDREGPARLVMKWGGALFGCDIGQSPLDVVAWHGNYVPMKYDLRRFCPVGAVLFDHPDPSIFTVLTAPSELAGTANADFVIFPERWMVAEDTFRPPWFHRNTMSEFMGLVEGVYDAKPEGFLPGGMSLHNQMLPHGPDAPAFEAASSAALAPAKLAGTLAFMFETRLPQRLTAYAAGLPERQAGYADCWAGLGRRFDPARREPG
ncbi:MAG: homogentisate 1,2-dioxygenase [Thalassobaculales bacterium]